jgi:hypothetical protein
MKIDLHVHSWYSADGVSPPEKMIKVARKKNENGLLDGMAITDHDTIKAWKQFKNPGFPVIFGEEIFSTRGHILGLFLNEEIKAREPVDVFDEIRSQDGLTVIPHPFDPLRKGFGSPAGYEKKIDAIEVYNSRMKTPQGNEKALEFAKKKKLPMTGGSDAHIRWCIGDAYTEADATDLDEFRKAVKKGRTRVSGRHSTLWVVLPITKLAKMRLIGRAP